MLEGFNFQQHFERKQATNGLPIQPRLGWINRFFRHLQTGPPGNHSRQAKQDTMRKQALSTGRYPNMDHLTSRTQD